MIDSVLFFHVEGENIYLLWGSHWEQAFTMKIPGNLFVSSGAKCPNFSHWKHGMFVGENLCKECAQ